MKRLISALYATLFLCLSGTSVCFAKAETVSGTGFYFDTVITIKLTAENADELLQGCMDLCQHLEDTFSAQKEGAELYQLNHRQSEKVEVSDELASCIDRALEFSQMSGGAFDLTILPLRQIWDFEGKQGLTALEYYGEEAKKKSLVPTESEIQDALSRVDYSRVHLDGNTVSFDRKDTMIDLGGIAKGWISSALKEYLKEEGCESACINLGGNVTTVGLKENGKNWTIGIQTPFSLRGEILTAVKAEPDHCIISSGTYERYFEEDGVLYHHILDPRSGYPAEVGLSQVSMVGMDDAACDALATIGLVLGREDFEKMMEENGREEEVLFTDEDLAFSWFNDGGEHERQ